MTQNIYQQLGLKQVINACGKMTILGVSSVAPEVMQATARALRPLLKLTAGGPYRRIGFPLHRRGGQLCYFVRLGGYCDCRCRRHYPRPGASHADAGQRGMANEVVTLRGHNVDYGAPITSAIRLGGGRVVEVGSSNLAARWQLESAITDNTAALLYVKSHHCVQKGMLSIADFVQVAQVHNLPLIVDAAAEEDLRLGGERGGYGGLQRGKSL
jgi:D-glucosaminate-6-phosphate ammonia-lyase